MRIQLSGILHIVALVFFLVAGAVNVVFMVRVGESDWYMHLGMWILIFGYYLLLVNAIWKKRHKRSWLNLVMLTVVSAFWAYVLYDRIPPRLVLDSLVEREALPTLWVSIVLLCLGVILVLTQMVIARLPAKPSEE